MNGTNLGSAPASASGLAGTLLQAFGGESNLKLRRAAQALTVGTAGWQLAQRVRARRRSARTFTVTVSDNDQVYEPLHGWLLEQMPAEDRRSLAVVTRRVSVGMIEDDSRPVPDPVRLHYDGRKVAEILVDGHKVVAVLEQPGDADDKMMMRRPAKLIFTCPTLAARDAVLEVIGRLVAEASERGPRLHMARYDYWYERKDIPDRPLDTVILRAGQREAIVDDLARFLASERLYGRLGLPWHRGYLFHGPPGTGKSSLARALASHFRLDVHFASLSDCKSNNSLLTLVGNLPARSMLLLEDVDVLKAATSREEGKPDEGDLSALLNALDGMATPHGLITVMTTNRLDALDEALLRPGRADRVEHIDYLDRDQAERLAELITGRPMPLKWVCERLTAADVLEAAKPHLDGDVAHLEAAVWDALTGWPVRDEEVAA